LKDASSGGRVITIKYKVEAEEEAQAPQPTKALAEPKKKTAFGIMRFVWYALFVFFALIALTGLLIELTQSTGTGAAAITPIVLCSSLAALFFWLGLRKKNESQ